MSRNWSWSHQDDQRVIDWCDKLSEKALVAGNDFLASEIQRGLSNFFALREMPCEVEQEGSNAGLVNDWIWEIHFQIYEGTSSITLVENELLEQVQPVYEQLKTHRSVIQCLQLLNSFFDLNDLHTPKAMTAGMRMPDLIIPESFDGDGIVS